MKYVGVLLMIMAMISCGSSSNKFKDSFNPAYQARDAGGLMLLLLEVPVPSRRLKRRIQQRRRLLITSEAYWEINVTKLNMKPSENM